MDDIPKFRIIYESGTLQHSNEFCIKIFFAGKLFIFIGVNIENTIA